MGMLDTVARRWNGERGFDGTDEGDNVVDFRNQPIEMKIPILEAFSGQQQNRLDENIQFYENHVAIYNRQAELTKISYDFIEQLRRQWALVDDELARIRSAVEELLDRVQVLTTDIDTNEGQIGFWKSKITEYENELLELRLREERARRSEEKTPERGFLRAQQNIIINGINRDNAEVARRRLPEKIDEYKHQYIPRAMVNLEVCEQELLIANGALRVESRNLDAVLEVCKGLCDLEVGIREKLRAELIGANARLASANDSTEGPDFGRYFSSAYGQIESTPPLTLGEEMEPDPFSVLDEVNKRQNSLAINWHNQEA